MDEFEFKKLYKTSACSSPPWVIFISVKDRPEILRIIRQECIDKYGYSFDECHKRLTCFTKQCLGRPLPWLSETAKPYLDKLKELQPNNFNKNNEYLVSTNCNNCPIRLVCKSPCNQVLDYIDRDKKLEPIIDYKDNTELLQSINENLEPSNSLIDGSVIPWDILSKRKQQVIKKYLYEGRDFRYVGESLGINNQARAKYEMYAAITKLAEYAIIRDFLNTNINKLTTRQQQIFNMVYYKNMTFVKVAKELNITKQSVQQTVARVIKKYKIKWKVYVKKKGNKVIYSVPEIFK